MSDAFNSLERITQLLHLVENCPNLYDSSRKGYRDSSLKRKTWDHIATTMQLTPTECKVEWERIREKYTKQYKRIRAERSGVAASIVDSIKLKWPVFDLLQFLEPHVQSRSRKKGWNSANHLDGKSIHSLDNDDDDYWRDQSEATVIKEGTVVQTSDFNVEFVSFLAQEESSKKPTVRKVTGLQKPKLTSGSDNVEDDSYHFAMSLVPTIRSLDDEQRCTAKLRIMEILHAIKYKKATG